MKKQPTIPRSCIPGSDAAFWYDLLYAMTSKDSYQIGMVKAGPDTNADENQGGFASDNSSIIGFSHMHDSGTGGVSSPLLNLESAG